MPSDYRKPLGTSRRRFLGQALTFNPLGVRGVGEVGITGVAAAVANAIYHATGKRFHHLPITPDKLMA